MEFKTLISVEGLAQFLDNPNWVVVDCRFWLDDAEKGRSDFEKSHIPGAVYAHLNEQLSAPVVAGKTGRHPLPSMDDISFQFGAWGIGDDTQVVAYDDRGGMIAARLWWLLRYLGHETVAVLDGGFPAWISERHPVNADVSSPQPRTFTPRPQPGMVITADDILAQFGNPGHMLVDSRAPERFRGETEPIDPIAGRIPGAHNQFWMDNLDTKGHFEAKDVLRGRFDTFFGDVPAQNVTFYCGSGVTGAHNVLAVAHSGLGMSRLYAGSWSDWITDPERPIATG